jgi:predicted house-cleaning noncanonical NTP pyrophosphatase (MazG superfamily)
MTIKKYDKLVRDRIPEIIESSGKRCKVQIASEEEYAAKLKEKLLEEANEFFENPSIEELADVQEVVTAIVKLKNWDVWDARLDKNIERGTFNNRYILKEVSE